MTDALVIGAGPTGLAVAAELAGLGVKARVFDRSDRVASSWHGHYGSLHLHTHRRRSGLPGRPLPENLPRFPSRVDMISYFERYADDKVADIRLGLEVQSVDPSPGGWRVTHTDGAEETRAVVFATGLNSRPRRPDWPGLEQFRGRILHTSDYQSSSDVEGDRVLVVGFGNSGADIALELANLGMRPHVAVRGPVNILPLTLLGLPITSLGLLPKLIGPRAADRFTAPLVRAAIGRPEDYGFECPEKGPAAQVVEDGRIPLIDHGALSAIREGRIQIRNGVEQLNGDEVVFANGDKEPFDTIILATGYDVDLRAFLPSTPDVLTPNGVPRVSGGPSGAEGLYFASYVASADGQLRQSGIDAKWIARDVARYLRAS